MIYRGKQTALTSLYYSTDGIIISHIMPQVVQKQTILSQNTHIIKNA